MPGFSSAGGCCVGRRGLVCRFLPRAFRRTKDVRPAELGCPLGWIFRFQVQLHPALCDGRQTGPQRVSTPMVPQGLSRPVVIPMAPHGFLRNSRWFEQRTEFFAGFLCVGKRSWANRGVSGCLAALGHSGGGEAEQAGGAERRCSGWHGQGGMCWDTTWKLAVAGLGKETGNV